MHWFVGTSGWSYDAWKGGFYPPDLPAKDRLKFYARHFDAVEINTTFYHLHGAKQIAAWEKSVPRNFTFTIKAWRYLTHWKRLKEPRYHLPALMKPLAARKKKGPVVFQLPPGFPKNTGRLEAFLKALPKRQRFAFEFRNKTWHDEEIFKLLKKYKAAFCLFEKGNLRSPRVVTANFIYVRLHGRKEGYKGNYSKKALRDWYRWLKKKGKDTYIFFDNTDEKFYALENARDFYKLTKEV